MKRIFAIIICAIAAMMPRSAEAQVQPLTRTVPDHQIDYAISNMIRQHPELRLQDIYKSFFQDRFGPGHIIPSKAAAQAYLMRELSECEEEKDPVPIEPVGCEGRYIRVSLYKVKSGEIELADYLEAFVGGARPIAEEEYEAWKSEWKRIADRAAAFGIKDYEADRKEIDALLAEYDGNLVLHHSPEYNEAYEPHYRIIERSRFVALICKN